MGWSTKSKAFLKSRYTMSVYLFIFIKFMTFRIKHVERLCYARMIPQKTVLMWKHDRRTGNTRNVSKLC